jgi:hypothetical protein
MPAPTDNRVSLSAERELDRILSLEQAAEVSSLSPTPSSVGMPTSWLICRRAAWAFDSATP